MLLAHAPSFENFLVIGFNQRIAEFPDLGITQNTHRRLYAIVRRVSQRPAESEAPMVISAWSSQIDVLSQSVNARYL